jgi:UDP:flavonoid glycosyltransferase YjiC (YdhE family)
MGHLTRQLAVALALGPSREPVLFSMSTALPVIRHFGIRGEYCPGPHRGWLPHVEWNGYVRDRLRALVAESSAKTVVFDGVVPYAGLLQARRSLPDVAFVWFRRGLWRKDAGSAALRTSALFDLIIEPGDLARTADRGPTARRSDAIQVPPVSLYDQVETLDRSSAAEKLGIPADRPTALVMLGMHRDMAHLTTSVVSSLVDLGWQVAVITGPLHNHGKMASTDPERVIELRNIFPISTYLSAFDVAISAAGYNSFHELIFGAVPTLFVPRPRGTDDQAARARWAAETGISLAVKAPEPSTVVRQLERLCDQEVRDGLRAACSRLPNAGGAGAAAEALLTLSGSTVARSVSLRQRLHLLELVGRANLLSALGTRRVALLRKMLGRAPHHGPDRALNVEIVDDTAFPRAVSDTSRGGGASPLLFTDRLGADWMSAAFPVEHVLPDASEHYREERQRIIRRYYDVR